MAKMPLNGGVGGFRVRVCATFGVPSPGPVLLYAAEDSEATLRLRLESLAQHHGLPLAYLDLRVVTADSLRLDRSWLPEFPIRSLAPNPNARWLTLTLPRAISMLRQDDPIE